MPAPNKPVAIMAAEVITQALVLRKNISDYPQCLEVDAATIAIGKTLGTSEGDSPRIRRNNDYCNKYIEYGNTNKTLDFKRLARK